MSEAEVVGRDVPLIVGYGGGVNSLAALVKMRRKGISPDLVSFANTGTPDGKGGERPETYEHLETVVRPWLLSAFGLDLVIVHKDSPRVGDQSLMEECLRRETLPSRAFGMSGCAQRWKIEPQEKYLNHWEPAQLSLSQGKKPIKALGYDGGEAGRRDGIGEDKKLRYWYPLIEWHMDRDACVAAIRGEGLLVPPKSACFYCPSSS